MASSLARVCSSSLLAWTFCNLVVWVMLDLRAILPAVADVALFAAASHGLSASFDSRLEFGFVVIGLNMDAGFSGGEASGREL